MTLEEAEKALNDDKVAEALKWALEQLKASKTEASERSVIKAWRNHVMRAELAIEALHMEIEYVYRTDPGQSSALRQLLLFADSLRSKQAEPRVTWLRPDELTSVLQDGNRHTLFIGGVAFLEAKTLMLIRGDFRKIEVPFSDFKASGDGIDPDFSRLSVIDYGHTVALGDYQAATDAILDEYEDVHTRHCCIYHGGCKYGDDDCTVTSGHKPQSYPCEDCDDDQL